MSQLGFYARRVAETKGLEHASCLYTLRLYLTETPRKDLVGAINTLGSFEEIRALWEAGLNQELQELALRRYDELKGRRG